MVKGKTTIIVPAYLNTELSLNMTIACIGNITKYTDDKDYELILIEDVPKHGFRNDWKTFRIEEHIILPERTNYATKMNMAAKKAKGEYLAFIQNDCFVWEGWLPNLRWYLEHGDGCIIPHQFPNKPRQWVKDTYTQTFEECRSQGARDACMIMITREAFDKTGGFNEDMEAFVEADFYERMGRVGVKQDTTSKVIVTHIGLSTHSQNQEEFDRAVHHDSLIRNK